MPAHYVNLSHARGEEQKFLMERIQKDGICPFCQEHLTVYHPKPILHETTHWSITENMTPYEGAKHHILFISKEHVTAPWELSEESKSDFFEAIRWATEYTKTSGASILMRFGDTEYTGSSVHHLHAHLVVGVAKEDDSEPLKVKLGYKKKS